MDVQLQSIPVKIDLIHLFPRVKLINLSFFFPDKIVAASLKRMRNKVFELEVQFIAKFSTDEGIEEYGLSRSLTHPFLSCRLGTYPNNKEIAFTMLGGNHSVIFGLLSQVVGILGSNIGGSPYIRFNQLVIARCFSNKECLKTQLIQNFTRQAVN